MKVERPCSALLGTVATRDMVRATRCLRQGLLASVVLVHAAAGQTVHTVELMHINFLPPELTIRLGDTVHWVWIEGIHNVESGIVQKGFGVHDGRFRSGDPDFALEFSLLFDRQFVDAQPAPEGIYPYYCLVHSFKGMTGVIEVVVSGDVDRDLDVDLADHDQFTDCNGGPDVTTAPPQCDPLDFQRADSDNDGDVDLLDFAALQNEFTG